jgi:NTE family protein
MGRQFTSIVISGGEFKAIAALGCIDELLKRQSFDVIRTLVGTSAGAIICTALAIGFSPRECIEFITNILTTDRYNHITTFDPLEVLNILDSYGCFSGNNITALIELILAHKQYGPETTFMDIAKRTGKNLVIAGANVSKERNEFFCVDSTPTMPVATALRITCSVPFLFAPVYYNDCLYVDGMMFNNCPINYLQSNLKDIFAVNIFKRLLDDGKTRPTFAKYIYNMLMSMQRTITKQNMQLSPAANIITIDMEEDGAMFDIENMKVKITPAQIETMCVRGRELCVGALTETD